jgi:hypothetical protein
MSRLRCERGQASVELVALLPLVVLVALALWQGVVAGQAMWLAGTAARAAARAQAIGEDPQDAAREAVPGHLRRGVRVADRGRDGIRVSIAIPAILGGMRLGSVGAQAHLQTQTAVAVAARA